VHDAYREQLLMNPEIIELPAQHIAGTIVAEVDGTVAGFAVTLGEGQIVELDGLFVEPALLRRGIGRALVRRAIADARRAGATRMHVISGPESAPFYQRCGFAVVGRVQTLLAAALRLETSLDQS